MNKKIICISIIALFLLTSAASASIVIGINAYEMEKSVEIESILVNDDSFDGYTLLNP